MVESLKSLDAIQEELMKQFPLKRMRTDVVLSYDNLHEISIDSESIAPRFPTKEAYYCTICKKIHLRRYGNFNDVIGGMVECVNEWGTPLHYMIPMTVKRAYCVEKAENIIKRSERKLSIYTWSYEPRFVWPKRNKKPSLLRTLNVKGITLSENGCYEWKFSLVNGKKKKNKKNTLGIKQKESSGIKVVHNGFDKEWINDKWHLFSKKPHTGFGYENGKVVEKKSVTHPELFHSFLGEISPAFSELRLLDYPFPLSKKVFSAAKQGPKELLKAIVGRNESSLIRVISQKIKGGDYIPIWCTISFMCRHVKDINILRTSLERNESFMFFRNMRPYPIGEIDLRTIYKTEMKITDSSCKKLTKRLSSEFSRDKVVRFIESMSPIATSTTIDDTGRMFSGLSNVEKSDIIRTINNRKEYTAHLLHDLCSETINKRANAKASEPFIFSEDIKKLECENENVKIALPNSPIEMQRWGSLLHNCVYSYASSVRNGHCMILGLFIEKELVACIEIEIRPTTTTIANNTSLQNITQFRGVNNSLLFEEIYFGNRFFMEWFEKNKLTIRDSEKQTIKI